MGDTPTVRSIATGTHGRYLVALPSGAGPWPMLVGFHGYMEHAERHLSHLKKIPGSADWLLVSVQGLHRFYTPNHRQVIASWMTSQDRKLAIADNLAYVGAVVGEVKQEFQTTDALVYAGFSQGVAMAYRAATLSIHPGTGILALAGDVPPELRDDLSITWPPVLVGRGQEDDWYTKAQMDADLAFLSPRVSWLESVEFDGGHEWTNEFLSESGRFLNACRLGIEHRRPGPLN